MTRVAFVDTTHVHSLDVVGRGDKFVIKNKEKNKFASFASSSLIAALETHTHTHDNTVYRCGVVHELFVDLSVWRYRITVLLLFEHTKKMYFFSFPIKFSLESVVSDLLVWRSTYLFRCGIFILIGEPIECGKKHTHTHTCRTINRYLRWIERLIRNRFASICLPLAMNVRRKFIFQWATQREQSEEEKNV